VILYRLRLDYKQLTATIRIHFNINRHDYGRAECMCFGAAARL